MRFSAIFILILIFAMAFNPLFSADDKDVSKFYVEKKGSGINLGIVIKELNDALKEKSGAELGAYVMHVMEESEADMKGLKKGDVIIEADGREITTAKTLDDVVEGKKTGDTFSVIFMRDGKEKSISVTLKEYDKRAVVFTDDNNSFFGKGKHFEFRFPGNLGSKNIESSSFKWFGENKKGAFLGVFTQDLNKEMLAYNEAENGVQITKIIKDSPAEKAGLKVGDIISFINDRKIEGYRDLTRNINFYNPKEEVEIAIMRKGSKKSFDVVLGEQTSHYDILGDHDALHNRKIETVIKNKPGLEVFDFKTDGIETRYYIL